MNYNFPGFGTIPHWQILLQLNVLLVTENLGVMACDIDVRFDHVALQAGIMIVEKAKRILGPSFALKLEAILKETKSYVIKQLGTSKTAINCYVLTMADSSLFPHLLLDGP